MTTKTSLSLNTVVHLTSWLITQSQPAPPKKTLLITRKTTSAAMVEFMVHYNRLIKSSIHSKSAFDLYRQVVRAETAKDLISRIPKLLEDEKVRDYLSQLQFLVFCAANWIRRFAEDRHNRAEFNMLFEKRESQNMATKMKDLVSDMFDYATQKNAGFRTNQVVFDTFNIRWKQQDELSQKAALVSNAKTMQRLEKAWSKVSSKSMADLPKRQQEQFLVCIDELEDSNSALIRSQQILVNSVKVWMQHEEKDEPWRTQGITTLGPFGIAGNLDMKISFRMEKHNHTMEFTMESPVEKVKEYEVGLKGPVRGKISPVVPVTVKRKDPVAELMRIPENARFFGFAYPVITASLEVNVENKSAVDAFLLFGGFVYFDKNMDFLQANGLWVGCNLQLGAPKPLPPAVVDILKEQQRFHDITLPNLQKQGARQFAWILPGEFREHMQIDHGGWCYLYDDPAVNNYFCIASADSVKGTTKTASSVVFD